MCGLNEQAVISLNSLVTKGNYNRSIVDFSVVSLDICILLFTRVLELSVLMTCGTRLSTYIISSNVTREPNFECVEA